MLGDETHHYWSSLEGDGERKLEDVTAGFKEVFGRS
jgi:hypothetical protein